MSDSYLGSSQTTPLPAMPSRTGAYNAVVRVFCSKAAFVGLVSAPLLEQNDAWQVKRRDLQLEGLQSLADNQVRT